MLEAVSEQSKHSNMHHLRSYQRYPQISLLTRGAEGNEMKMYLSDLISQQQALSPGAIYRDQSS